MRLYEKVVLAAGLVVVGVTLAYRYALTDEQREAAREATDVLRGATREVTDSVSPLVKDGPTRTEEEAEAAANRARTAAEWKAIGY